jgi:hypothetical protein
MSHASLQLLIGTALTDTDFRKKLLNGQRRSVLTNFDLTDEETQFLYTIQAHDLQEFAIRLDEWLSSQAIPTDAHEIALT